MYQKENSYPIGMRTLEKKDSFVPLYDLGIKNKSTSYTASLFHNSQLRRLGLVNEVKLLEAYDKYVNNNGSEESFYGLASAELFLRSIH